MGRRHVYVGLDVGSAYVHVALINDAGQLIVTKSSAHHGRIEQTIRSLLRNHAGKIAGIYQNVRGARLVQLGPSTDDQIAVLTGARHLGLESQTILHVGAEKFYLILLSEDGNYRKSVTNTGCASGTGSFLDQQAARLNLSSPAELAELATHFQGDPPPIATRCAVFAKTDLIHAQQKGYSLAAICAGVCRGVARNVAETIGSLELPDPVVFSGGVALNRRVVDELSRVLGRRLVVPANPQTLAAVGLAHLALRESEKWDSEALERFLREAPSDRPKRSYHYGPLKSIPYRRPSARLAKSQTIHDVEVEIYEPARTGHQLQAFLGIDVGSTSTKAALVSEEGQVLVSLYTRTQGQPISAVQCLFRALRWLEREENLSFELLACGTTGSGRKLIQKVLNADLAVDEITAHARAAYELRPDVDTIIEIGGQDSKFTVLRNGRVVFSVMNFVCAAGTGSFLEEQANKLGVPLERYGELAEKASAPLTSDRCTVFMERDLNHLLSQGYSRDELLAAATHSVRDNYLSKVANLQKIGNVIVFQGATGRNSALVKAFEQKLGKPIYVSPHCHVAGAIGVALILKDRGIRLNPRFRHDFERSEVRVEEDVCQLCNNHCKITRIDLGGERLSWGFLCGREDSDPRPKRRDDRLNHVQAYRRTLRARPPRELRSAAPKLLPLPEFSAVREKVLDLRQWVRRTVGLAQQDTPEPRPVRIGIPHTLNLLDTLPLWRAFFAQLGWIPVSFPPGPRAMERGRALVEADFCAPIALLHGHVAELAERVDYLFLPVLFRNGLTDQKKHYCYYSNYAAALIQNNAQLGLESRLISPVVDLDQEPGRIAEAIYEELPAELRRGAALSELERAWAEARSWFQSEILKLRERFAEARRQLDGIGVVLLGRPYLVLDDRLSHNIAQRIAEMGIPVFYQEMLPTQTTSSPVGTQYLDWTHWHYGDSILRAAEYVARDEKLFPIYLTAFKCSPDSFVIPYFRELMDRYDKPYLVLQLDDHTGAEGYETRLEAAIETFRNHAGKTREPEPLHFQISSWPKRRTYLLPNYDPYSTELMAAAFRRRGIEAIPLEETDETIQESVRYNDGQCLPFSAILQAIKHTMRKYELDPARTGFFINALCELSCNLPQYPLLMKQMLEKMGDGLEQLDVLATGTAFDGMPFPLLVDIYCAYLLGGLLQKLACKVRPREIERGLTDATVEKALRYLSQAFEEGQSKELAFREVVEWFERIPTDPRKANLPQVAIIGDLYVRDNHVFNQNLIRELESIGAEVITTPYSFIIRLLATKHFRNLALNRRYASLALDKSLLLAFTYFDRKFTRISYPVLREPLPRYDGNLLSHLERYHLHFRHPGETSQNLMKIFHLLEQYPDIRLFVHVNPIFCCPGLVSEAIFKRVEEEIGVPIVSIVYDGTKGDQNQVIRPYLHFIRERMQSSGAELETRGEEEIAA